MITAALVVVAAAFGNLTTPADPDHEGPKPSSPEFDPLDGKTDYFKPSTGHIISALAGYVLLFTLLGTLGLSTLGVIAAASGEPAAMLLLAAVGCGIASWWLLRFVAQRSDTTS